MANPGDTDSELTPESVWSPVLRSLDRSSFDLDPCSHAQATVPTTRRIVLPEDGLMAIWHGLVWCNPPYSAPNPWVERCASHPGGAAMLLNCDTSTRIWRAVIWPRATLIVFWYGRICFVSPANPERKNVAKRASALVLFGAVDCNVEVLQDFGKVIVP